MRGKSCDKFLEKRLRGGEYSCIRLKREDKAPYHTTNGRSGEGGMEQLKRRGEEESLVLAAEVNAAPDAP